MTWYCGKGFWNAPCYGLHISQDLVTDHKRAGRRTDEMDSSSGVYFFDLLFENFSTVERTARCGHASDEDFSADGFEDFLDTSPMCDFERSYGGADSDRVEAE